MTIGVAASEARWGGGGRPLLALGSVGTLAAPLAIITYTFMVVCLYALIRDFLYGAMEQRDGSFKRETENRKKQIKPHPNSTAINLYTIKEGEKRTQIYALGK